MQTSRCTWTLVSHDKEVEKLWGPPAPAAEAAPALPSSEGGGAQTPSSSPSLTAAALAQHNSNKAQGTSAPGTPSALYSRRAAANFISRLSNNQKRLKELHPSLQEALQDVQAKSHLIDRLCALGASAAQSLTKSQSTSLFFVILHSAGCQEPPVCMCSF